MIEAVGVIDSVIKLVAVLLFISNYRKAHKIKKLNGSITQASLYLIQSAICLIIVGIY